MYNKMHDETMIYHIIYPEDMINQDETCSVLRCAVIPASKLLIMGICYSYIIYNHKITVKSIMN